MAGDVRRLVGGEERYGAGDIADRSYPAQRNLLSSILLEFVSEYVGHGGFNEARSHRVAGYIARSQFAGNSHRESDETSFRRSIIRLTSLAHLAEDAGNIDDASPALLQHGAGDLLNTEIRGGEIGLQHGIPVGPFHADDELVAGDAGIVDQNVDLPELGDGGLDRGLDLLFIRDVDRKRGSFPAGGGDLVYQFVQLLVISRGDGNRRAFCGELQCAGSSNA